MLVCSTSDLYFVKNIRIIAAFLYFFLIAGFIPISKTYGLLFAILLLFWVITELRERVILHTFSTGSKGLMANKIQSCNTYRLSISLPAILACQLKVWKVASCPTFVLSSRFSRPSVVTQMPKPGWTPRNHHLKRLRNKTYCEWSNHCIQGSFKKTIPHLRRGSFFGSKRRRRASWRNTNKRRVASNNPTGEYRTMTKFQKGPSDTRLVEKQEETHVSSPQMKEQETKGDQPSTVKQLRDVHAESRAAQLRPKPNREHSPVEWSSPKVRLPRRQSRELHHPEEISDRPSSKLKAKVPWHEKTLQA